MNTKMHAAGARLPDPDNPRALARLRTVARGPRHSGAEVAPVRAKSLADAIASAEPGDTIVLPAGVFEAGVTLPPRVSLRGAGYRKTILDARKAEVGLAIEGGEGAEIADLTVWVRARPVCSSRVPPTSHCAGCARPAAWAA